MKTKTLFFLFALLGLLFSCSSNDDEDINKIVSKNLDIEILKGNTTTIKLNAQNTDYYFDIDYSYTYSNGANMEAWSFFITTSNIGGIEPILNASGNHIDKIDDGILINESKFSSPVSGGYFFTAERNFNQSDFTYHFDNHAEFYKFYYIPIKFPTNNTNNQAGAPFYGYLLVYLHPDKIIIGNYAYNSGGNISAGDK